MDINVKIQAIKELRNRCDLTLVQAKDKIEAYYTAHPLAQFGDMVDAIAAGERPRTPSKETQIDTLSAELATLKRAHERLWEAAHDAVAEYFGSGSGMVSELAHAMECLQSRLKES